MGPAHLLEARWWHEVRLGRQGQKVLQLQRLLPGAVLRNGELRQQHLGPWSWPFFMAKTTVEKMPGPNGVAKKKKKLPFPLSHFHLPYLPFLSFQTPGPTSFCFLTSAHCRAMSRACTRLSGPKPRGASTGTPPTGPTGASPVPPDPAADMAVPSRGAPNKGRVFGRFPGDF